MQYVAKNKSTVYVQGFVRDKNTEQPGTEPESNTTGSVKISRKRVFSRREHEPSHAEPKIPHGEARTKACCKDECKNGIQLEDWVELSLQTKEEFVKQSKLETTNKLLQHVNAQRNMGIQTDCINWQGKFFCTEAFSDLSGISSYTVCKVLSSHKMGVKVLKHGNCGLSKYSLQTMSFKVWIRQFLELNSQSAPDSNVQVLPHWLTIKSIYQMYKEGCIEPHLAETTFYQYIPKYFGPHRQDKSEPQVRFSRYSSHSVCDQCHAFNNARRTSKTQEDLKLVNQSKMCHMSKVSGARRRMEEIKQQAIQFPNDAVCLQVDGMDNSKSYCPRMKEKSKKFAGILRLPTKIQGCIIYSGHYLEKRKTVFYLNHDQYPQSSNMVVSIIYKLLKVFVNDFKKLPKKLHIFADNCWRENKNRYVFGFLDWLVELGVFQEVTLNFLIVGHTGTVNLKFMQLEIQLFH